MGVDAGAYRRTALGQPCQPYHGAVDTLDGLADLARPTAKLLPQAQRHGIHQMGAPRLHHAVQFQRPLVDGGTQCHQRGT